jgi:hypothetical protein
LAKPCCFRDAGEFRAIKGRGTAYNAPGLAPGPCRGVCIALVGEAVLDGARRGIIIDHMRRAPVRADMILLRRLGVCRGNLRVPGVSRNRSGFVQQVEVCAIV